jgi:2-methylcitrate dehydratase PrpD
VTELEALATFAAGLTYDRLPPAVRERAALVIADSVGAVLGGLQEPEVRALADYAARTGPGPATLVGHGARVTPPLASLVHGTAGVTLELDEGHAHARGHAAVHAVWPALALGEAAGASGREVVTAMVAGYEVAARVGVACRLRRPVHPFGTWGVLGAATVAAWFRGLDGRALREVLELAASYAITPSFATATQGATVRNTYPGVVNQLGLLAVELHGLGFRGERGGLRTAFGELLGEAFAPAALAEGLGERWELLRGYFKTHSACRYTHAAVDALLALRAGEDGLRPADVVRVEVATYDAAARLDHPHPATPLAARFSLPYVVAATLVHGSAGPEVFAAARLGDPEVRRLAGAVHVVEDPALTAMTPACRPARVTLGLVDGRRLTKTVLGSRGDPDQPLGPDELARKFEQLAGPRLGRVGAGAAWGALLALEAAPDVTAVVRRLAPPAGG